MTEAVNHPKHYGGDTPLECIKFLDDAGLAWAFSLGSAIKYLTREGRKDGESSIRELEKALWYAKFALGVSHRPPPPSIRRISALAYARFHGLTESAEIAIEHLRSGKPDFAIPHIESLIELAKAREGGAR